MGILHAVSSCLTSLTNLNDWDVLQATDTILEFENNRLITLFVIQVSIF
jgi:hypothetical protein